MPDGFNWETLFRPPTEWPWLKPMFDPEFDKYRDAGGTLHYDAWVEAGRPSTPSPVGLTYKAKQALEKRGLPIPPGVTFAEPTPREEVGVALEPEREAAGVDLGAGMPVRWETVTEGGWTYNVGYDEEGNIVSRDPLGRVAEPTPTYPREPTQPETWTDNSGNVMAWDEDKNDYIKVGYDPAKDLSRQPLPISPSQQREFDIMQQQFGQTLGLQQQQFAAGQQQFQQQLEFEQAQAQAAQEEQERQYRSQLAAQPINWLQYAAYTGEEPVIQPWMVPLGFQNVGGQMTPQGQPQPGQPIPGVQMGQAGQQGIQTFAGLPQLTTPSAQLQARWGPTAQAQFLGYRQARTGAAPEETQFRLGAGRAPTGAFRGFSRFR